jgi:alkylation response protein AidB-like acyl-CoA dehydrogenase
MEEATAVSIGRSALDGALRYAKSATAEAAAQQLGVQREKAFVTGELEMMQSVILAERPREGEVATTWARQVRDVAYDVEDGLRDLVLRVHGQPWWRGLLDRRRVADDMKELRARVEDVGMRSVRYRLVDCTSRVSDIPVDTDAADAAMLGAVEDGTRHVKNQQVLTSSQSRLTN